MGYYTNYSMEVLDIDNKGYNSYKIAKFMFNEKENFDKFYAFENELSEFIKNINVKEGINYKLSLDSVGEYKWYSHEEEMLSLSKKFSNVLFKLHSEGEENTDCWNKYFMNGKMQYCPAEIAYEPFDKNKLY